MTNRRTPGCIAVCAALLAWVTGCAVPQPRGVGHLEHRTEPTMKRGYWLYLPAGYDPKTSGDGPYPLVVSFHGMKPFDNAYAQACEWQQEADRFGFIVVAPELNSADVLAPFPVRTVHPSFAEDARGAIAALNHVIATTKADAHNVLSTSWSSGGYMAHYVLNQYPERFTALGVRQSNFSSAVLDAEKTKRSTYHPILILNTENDLAVCRRESKEAVAWYESHGYKNMYWMVIRQKGHERTPDMAADFFARITQRPPRTPPTELVMRQAIDGNQRGMQLMSGRLASLESSPQVAVDAPRQTDPNFAKTRPAPTRTGPALSRRPAEPPTRRATATPARTPPASDTTFAASSGSPTPQRAPAIPAAAANRPSPLGIRISSAVGVEPLHLDFSADCPASWYASTDFLWTLDGIPIASGLNGQKTITDPGEHVLALLAVTVDGFEYRASKNIRVIASGGADSSLN